MIDEGGGTSPTRDLVNAYLAVKTNFTQLELLEVQILSQLNKNNFHRYQHNRRYYDEGELHGLKYEPTQDTRTKRQKLKSNGEWLSCFKSRQDLLKKWQNEIKLYKDRHKDRTKKEAIRSFDDQIETSRTWFSEEIADRISNDTDTRTIINYFDSKTEEQQNKELLRQWIVRYQPGGNELIAEVFNTSTDYVRDVLKQRPESSVTDAVKKAVATRDNEECVVCGESTELRYHHIVPVSESGTGNKENIALLCHDCHVEAHGGTHWDTVYDSVEDFWRWVEEH